MTKEQRHASEILFDLVSSLEPRLKTLANWFTDLVDTIDLWQRSEGNQGVKRAKDILGQGWLAILGEETSQLTFVNYENDLPKLVIPLVRRVKSLKLDARSLSAVLSLIRVTDLFMGQLQDSTIMDGLDVIQNTKLSSKASAIIQEFETFIPEFLKRYPDHPVCKAWERMIHLDDSSTAYYRESKGPNGSLTANAHKDLKTLMEVTASDGISLLDHITLLEQTICDNADQSFSPDTKFEEALVQWEGFKDIQCSEIPGKITCIPEKSGKVRLIAQPDYYSQLALKPVHNWLFGVLTSFDADCTMDQRSAIPKICAWHERGNEIYSFDQSSCTDLFPFDLQLCLLRTRFGEPLTESVKTVMSDRDWSLKLPSGRTKKIRWSVGQPMGMLASWPLMALAHHFLVQFCYWKSSGKTFPKKGGPFNDYVICGDDIVISSRSVAQCYLKTVTSLGMKVNRSKSHVSGGTSNIPPVSEFAKITVWKGQPLYPIRPNMILSSIKDWRYAVPLFVDLANVDGFNARFKLIERLVKKHYTRGYKFLSALLSIPRELGGVGYRDSVSIKKKFQLIDSRQIHPWLYFLACRIRSGLQTAQKEFVCEEIQDLPGNLYRLHPLRTYSDRILTLNGWSSIYYDPGIPSVPDICLELVEDGIGPYDRFLVPHDSAVPPHWELTERTMLDQRTSWEKALAKPHFFPRDPKFPPLVDTSGSVVLEAKSIFSPAEQSSHRQYEIVRNTLLARRSTKE